MTKILTGLMLLVVSTTLHAAAITQLTITGGYFEMVGAGGTINPAAFADMTIGGYDGGVPVIDTANPENNTEASYAPTSIATLEFGVFGPLAIYTAEADDVLTGFAPVTGDLTGSILTLDLSSWTAYWNELSFNQGGIVTTTVDVNGDFTASWDVVAAGSIIDGQPSSWTITGNAGISAVPVPAAVWLFGSGLLGLAGIARRVKAA